MSFGRDFRAMTRKALQAKPVAGCSGAALMHFQILGGLLLLSAP
jgi:hypothetical protein